MSKKSEESKKIRDEATADKQTATKNGKDFQSESSPPPSAKKRGRPAKRPEDWTKRDIIREMGFNPFRKWTKAEKEQRDKMVLERLDGGPGFFYTKNARGKWVEEEDEFDKEELAKHYAQMEEAKKCFKPWTEYQLSDESIKKDIRYDNLGVERLGIPTSQLPQYHRYKIIMDRTVIAERNVRLLENQQGKSLSGFKRNILRYEEVKKLKAAKEHERYERRKERKKLNRNSAGEDI